MNQHSLIETILGGIVILVALFFLVFAYQSAGLGQSVGGYKLGAAFPSIEGVKSGSDVRINGIKVGYVISEKLEKESFMANLIIEVENGIKLPRDTIASIANESLLGGRYVKLEPGVEETYIPHDGTGQITNTQAPILLDDLIGRFVFSANNNEAQSTTPENAVAPIAPDQSTTDFTPPPQMPGDLPNLPDPIRTSP